MTPKQLLAKRWYEKNKELTKKRAAVWQKLNKEKRSKIRNKWRNNNIVKVREIEKKSQAKNSHKKALRQIKYRKENPGLSASYCAIRRALLLQRTPKWLSEQHKDEIKQFYIDAADCQWLSSEPLHVDHIVPLKGKNVSGLHVPWNLRVILRSDNCKKSNKYESF